MTRKHLRWRWVLLGVLACSDDPTAVNERDPSGLGPIAGNMDVGDDGDGVTTFGCPMGLPAPGNNPIVIGDAGYAYIAIKPGIMRMFRLPLPWSYQSRRTARIGQLCMYTHSSPGTTEADGGLPAGDWQVTGGIIIMRSLAFRRQGNWFGAGYVAGYQGGQFTRTTPPGGDDEGGCEEPDTQIIYDPNDDDDSNLNCGSGNGGDNPGGGDLNCHQEHIYIEAWTDSGWETLWQGYATVCE